MAVKALLVTIALAAIVTTARAEPFRPTDPQRVLLRIGNSGADSRKAPESLADALRQAAALIDEGRRSGQPRGLGRAEAILQSWRLRAQSAVDWYVLLADIRQYRHEYSGALALLDRALVLDSRHVRARLMRAAIWQTRGEFEPAREDCTHLLQQGETALGSACLAQVISVTGQLDRAYAVLRQQVELELERGRRANPSVDVWMLTALADMAERRGDLAAAERHLRDALRIDPREQFSRLALADLLLGQARAGEVAALLDGQPASRAVLLRLAEAKRASGGEVAQILERVRQGVTEADARGEMMDGRDVARLRLLEHRPCEALAAARENWRTQRESADVHLLLATAAACGDRQVQKDFARWRALHRYEDVRADALLSASERPT